MEALSLANILSVIALFAGLGFAGWVRYLAAKASAGLEIKIKDLEGRCGSLRATNKELDGKLQIAEKEIVRFQEFVKNTNQRLKELHADSIRDTQIMGKQLETIHNKIAHVDEKLDRVRNGTRR